MKGAIEIERAIERAVDVVFQLIEDRQFYETMLAHAKFLDDQRSLENWIDRLTQECDAARQEHDRLTQEYDAARQEHDRLAQKYNDLMAMMTVAAREGKTAEEFMQSLSGSQMTPSA